MNDISISNTGLRATPRFRCPACGSPEAKGTIGSSKVTIYCNKCGIEMERPRCGTELEDACEIINEAEKLRYKVDKYNDRR